MGGGPTINYKPPPPDDSFAKYLEYTKEEASLAAQRAAQVREEAKAAEEARKAAGAAAFGSLKQTTQQQLAQGLIGYESAQQQLRDYAARYDLAPPESDIQELTQQYLSALPGKREVNIKATYQDLYGRQPTAEELTESQTRFSTGFYSSMEDFKSSLKQKPEYTDKFEKSYLDNYYTTMFGSQTVDEQGKKTGNRTFKFDANLLPQYGGDLASLTKVTTPDFGKEFIGTPAEIEAQQQNIRDTRQYLYSAGLTNLQGEIDANIQKLKKESAKEVAQIGAKGSMYSNLLSGFWG